MEKSNSKLEAEKFNKALKDFIAQIMNLWLSKKEQDAINNYYNFDDMEKEDYVKMFFENSKKLGNDMSNRDEIIFSEENVI